MTDIACREDPAYDVTWPWHDGPLPPGLTAVLRVRDEARNLPWVLPPMLAAVDHVVLVDNGSTDGTLETAERLAAGSDRLTTTTYPWQVARAGAEHLATPPDSARSLVHYYNWAFSHARTAYSMKWDGDMALTPEGVAFLQDLSWQLRGSSTVVLIPRHPLWVESEAVAWLDLGYRFLEPWVSPTGPATTFVKAFEWEVREMPREAERLIAPNGLCVELKWLDVDEFDHWSSTASLPGLRATRKQRELEVQAALVTGRGEEVPRLVRVEAPPGVHVVDHVVGTWLREADRPLVVFPDGTVP